jgi:hypothetical protein
MPVPTGRLPGFRPPKDIGTNPIGKISRGGITGPIVGGVGIEGCGDG